MHTTGGVGALALARAAGLAADGRLRVPHEAVPQITPWTKAR
jgi:hypothetical protein